MTIHGLDELATIKTDGTHHITDGDLTVVLLIAGSHRQLSLSRKRARPSAAQRDEARARLNVPQSAEKKITAHNDYSIIRYTWSVSSHYTKMLRVAQAHLAPGWSVTQWEQVLDAFNIGEIGGATEKQLDSVLLAIYGDK